MKRVLVPVSLVLVIFGVVGFLVKDTIRPKVAGLTVESEPAARVFVDGDEVGSSPYSGQREPGEVVVKLVPLTTTTPLAPYEMKVKLEAGVETVVRRWFGASEELSSGEIVSLEKYDGGDKEVGVVVVVSTPDAAAVRLNGVLKGFTPLVQEGVSVGEYQLAVAAEGWRERVVSVKVEPKHRLTLTVKLAKEEGEGEEVLEEGEEASESGEIREGEEGEVGRPYVEIEETPTGWLRVRADASTGSEELAKVDAGEKYPFLEKTESGWYKIAYEEGEEGWVSGQYAKLVE